MSMNCNSKLAAIGPGPVAVGKHETRPMNLYQQALRIFYRIRMKFSKVTGAGIHILSNMMNKTPLVSFYSLQAQANNGKTISFDQYRGKHVLLINLASNCGYTGQYEEL